MNKSSEIQLEILKHLKKSGSLIDTAVHISNKLNIEIDTVGKIISANSSLKELIRDEAEINNLLKK